MTSVNKACEILQQAVEAEIPLQPQLILEGDKFYIDPNTALFPDPLPPLEPSAEKKDEVTLTIKQLRTFIGIFVDLAPSGVLTERCFTYLIQDVIMEDGKELMVPELWKQLSPPQVDLLCTKLFGKPEFIDWRDFIVFTIDIPCPDEVELMEARQNFRETDPDRTETVKDYIFYSTRLWFEYCFNKNDVGEMKRLWDLKRLFFCLFKFDDETLNYTAFLLRFCKDRHPVLGFAKALQLSLGRRICWQKAVGEAYVEKIRAKRRIEEKERLRQEMLHKKVEELCQELVVETADQVVHVCDSVVIEDYISEDSKVGSCISEERSMADVIDYLTKQEKEDKEESDSTAEDEQERSISNFLLDDKFSNVEIGFEPTEDPPKAFFLPLEAVLTVATATMLPNSTAPAFDESTLQEKIKLIYENNIREEFNNAVLAHEFLNDAKFVSLLVSSCKFEEKHASEKVKDLVADVNSCTQ